MSVLRKRYFARLVFRIVVFLLCFCFCLIRPSAFGILEGFQFFRQFSLLHLLWLIWVIDMICQLFPIKNRIPLGSQKLFELHFKPIRDKINYQALRNYVVSTTKSAYKVLLLWVALLTVLGVLYFTHIIDRKVLFMVCALFYVCDLICVLIWCPFRLILKNRCCTTCRIFNWDHMMMLTPMMFVDSFFSWSLLLMALAVWLLWELSFMMYPERFWEHSNQALQCAQCTDKLCTQYCRKLRP